MKLPRDMDAPELIKALGRIGSAPFAKRAATFDWRRMNQAGTR